MGCGSISTKEVSYLSEDEVNVFQPLEDLKSLCRPQLYMFSPRPQNPQSQEAKLMSSVDAVLKNSKTQLKKIYDVQISKVSKEDNHHNILLYISVEKELQNLNIPQYRSFQKIAFCSNSPVNAKQQEYFETKYGYRYGGVFAFHAQKIVEFFQKASSGRQIYSCSKDIGPINRLWALAKFYFQGTYKGQFEHFLQGVSALQLEGGKPQQRELRQNHEHLEKWTSMLINGRSFLTSVVDLFKVTQNPGVLNYFSWFYQKLQNATRQPRPKQQPEFPRYIYFVAKLKEQEISLLKMNVNFMFSTFKIGFLVQKDAMMQKQKSKDNFLFKVKLFEGDRGYCMYEKRIIFGLTSVFQVLKRDSTTRSIQCVYGNLQAQVQYRKEKFRYYTNASLDNVCMLKLYDNARFSKFNNHTSLDLLVHLQMYNTYKRFLQKRRSLPGFKDRSNTLQTAPTDDQSLPQKTLLQLIDVQMQLKNYQAVQSGISRMETKENLMLLKKLQYLYDSGLKNLFMRVNEISKQRLKSQDIKDGYLKIATLNYHSLGLAQDQKLFEADNIFQKCVSLHRTQFSRQFLHKNQFVEDSKQSFPFEFMLTKTKIAILKKNKEPQQQQIESQEDYLKNGEKFFDGIHINWIPLIS